MLIHLCAHGLDLLLSGLQFRRLVAVCHELGIDGFGKPLGHLLSTWPVHVLDEQVASHSPQLWVALQQLGHGFQGLLTLGRVAWAGGHHNVVLADAVGCRSSRSRCRCSVDDLVDLLLAGQG